MQKTPGMGNSSMFQNVELFINDFCKNSFKGFEIEEDFEGHLRVIKHYNVKGQRKRSIMLNSASMSLPLELKLHQPLLA